MEAYKTTARIVGELYVVGTAAGVLGPVFTGPDRDARGLLAGVVQKGDER